MVTEALAQRRVAQLPACIGEQLYLRKANKMYKL